MSKNRWNAAFGDEFFFQIIIFSIFNKFILNYVKKDLFWVMLKNHLLAIKPKHNAERSKIDVYIHFGGEGAFKKIPSRFFWKIVKICKKWHFFLNPENGIMMKTWRPLSFWVQMYIIILFLKIIVKNNFHLNFWKFLKKWVLQLPYPFEVISQILWAPSYDPTVFRFSEKKAQRLAHYSAQLSHKSKNYPN